MATQRTRAWSERPIGRDARPYTDSVAVVNGEADLPRGYLHLADVFAQAKPSDTAASEALYALKIEARKLGANAVAVVEQGVTNVEQTGPAPFPTAGDAPSPTATFKARIYLIKAKAYYWALDSPMVWPADSLRTDG